MTDKEIFAELVRIKPKIPHRVYKSIVGQLKAGHPEAALKGINNIKDLIRRKKIHEHYYSNRQTHEGR